MLKVDIRILILNILNLLMVLLLINLLSSKKKKYGELDKNLHSNFHKIK